MITGYNPHIAARLCFLSDLAYDCWRDEEKNPGGAYIQDNFAFILREEGGRRLVAFQGSDDAEDFLLDACCLITEHDEEPAFPPVHSGFWKFAMALLEPVREALSYGDQGLPIHIGGHSLGYGGGQIIAILLAEMGYPVASVYGFGGPPVGAVKFFNYCAHYKIPTFLLAYRRDGVPYLQPKGVHVAPVIHLDERAYVRKDREPRAWFNPFRWNAWRADHDSQNYLAATAKIEDRGGL